VKIAAPATDTAADSGPADHSPRESVAVIAVTGAVKAVTGDVTVVTRALTPRRHDRRDRWSLAQSPGRLGVESESLVLFC
jgi:hypothetical protein